ncbi:hypothetical protein [Rhizobium giardinii]|uniref:hypothetical protein n=1 Tax=Rhizobium giardinii TaxID=56731 RepID=UPI003D6FE8FB
MRDHDNVSSVASALGMNHFLDSAAQMLESTPIFHARCRKAKGSGNAFEPEGQQRLTDGIYSSKTGGLRHFRNALIWSQQMPRAAAIPSSYSRFRSLF